MDPLAENCAEIADRGASRLAVNAVSRAGLELADRAGLELADGARVGVRGAGLSCRFQVEVSPRGSRLYRRRIIFRHYDSFKIYKTNTRFHV